MSEYVIIYGKVTEDKEIGILFTYPYFGGEAETMEEAEELTKRLVNETKQAIVVPHIFHRTRSAGLPVLMEEAKKRFRRMEEDMYDCEEIYEKRGKHK